MSIEIKKKLEVSLPNYQVEELDDCYVLTTLVGMQIPKTLLLTEDSNFQSVIKEIKTAFAPKGVEEYDLS